jgi:hypothetical protein
MKRTLISEKCFSAKEIKAGFYVVTKTLLDQNVPRLFRVLF